VSSVPRSSPRLTSIVILAGLLVAGLVIDSTRSTSSPSNPAVVAGISTPAARPEPTLASTWFCAGGTAVASGFADHVVVMSNPSDRARTATITALSGSIAADPGATSGSSSTTTTAPAVPTTVPPKVATVKLPARSTTSFRMGGLVNAPLAGAIVEVDGGDIAVEHELSGALGKATSPCSSTTSSTWSFPWGVTSRGDHDLLVFMNPFPDDATVDISFATDEGVRQTVRFQGFVVPGRSVIGAYIDQDVTRKEQVSAQVQVRNGHLVVDQIQTFDGTDGHTGLTVTLGAPRPAPGWVFADGLLTSGLSEQIIVYNPSASDVAEADVDVLLDDPNKNGTPEPFELEIPPRRYVIVELQDEERIPKDVGHSTYVVSMNGVPIVAQRFVAGVSPAPRKGVSVTMGAPVAAPTWYLAGGGTSSSRDEFVTLVNPGDHTVRYRVTGLANGRDLPIEGLQDLELKSGARVSIRLGDHVQRDPLGLVVTATGPIVVERGLYRVGGSGISQSMGIPLAEGAVAPKVPS
jgi:hypothetical protein